MLQRTMLYTAMSRAKELLVLACNPGVVQYCVKKVDTLGRRTNLRARIENKMSKDASDASTKTSSKTSPKTSLKSQTPKKPLIQSTQEFQFDDLPF